MKKILFLMLMFISCLNINAQQTNIWANNSIGLGWSATNRDGWKDNNIEFNLLAYGVYFDASIGTDLKDYGYPSDLKSYSLNFGYEFPIVIVPKFKLLAGPIIGYTAMGHEVGDWEDDFYTKYSYFNYGIGAQIGIDRFALNCKVTRNNIGVGIGYIF